MSVGLQIIQVNDVYEIDNWPQFKTARSEAAASFKKFGPTIGVLPGDFVAPSLLSSLDKGNGMVDCMNASGIDYVCIGNHESDIPLANLHARMKQSRFMWINSNMPNFPQPTEGPDLPQFHIIEITSSTDSHHKRKVGLIGFCGEDRSVMKPGAFGDCTIQPLTPRCKQLVAFLIDEMGCDAVVPLTHQLVGMDRDLAASFLPQHGEKVPLILGGHDHEPYNESILAPSYECKVVKTGADGKLIATCTLMWPEKDSVAPTCSVTMTPSSNYSPDPEVAHVVEGHKEILKELEKSVLCSIPSELDNSFSSVGMRQHPTSVGTFLCTVIRDALQLEVVLIGAGSIRGNRNYKGEKSFTYAHLKSEIPFDTCITVVPLPGSVIAGMVEFTRAFSLLSPPVEKGAYLQTDDRVGWDRDTNKVTEVCGLPLIPEKIYRVGCNHGMLQGLDNVVPLTEYMAKCPPDHEIHKSPEGSHNAKEVIVSHFSQLLLFDMVSKAGGFESIDANSDDVITKEELASAMAMSGHGNGATKILIDNLFACVDADGNGLISKSEVLDFSLSCMLKMNFREAISRPDALISIDDIIQDLRAHRGASSTVFSVVEEEFIRSSLMQVDVDGSGHISKEEYAKFLDSSFGLSLTGEKRISI